MRAFRTVAVAVTVVLAGVVALSGCGSGGPPEPDGANGGSAGPRTATTADPHPGPAGSPAASPGASRSPAAGETLVRVSRSGGFAGETRTLVVTGDGSWTRLDGRAEPEGSGKLTAAGLEALRTALRQADFARLPRVATAERPVHDGFMYAFVHGGFEVAADQSSLAPGLEKVLATLPGLDQAS
ncbi:hypothetical protein ACWDYJ_08605 [Streptomyces sp. NPDC003042]